MDSGLGSGLVTKAKGTRATSAQECPHLITLTVFLILAILRDVE